MKTEVYFEMIDQNVACYIANADATGISDDEQQQADEMMREYNALGDHATFGFYEENFDYDTREYKAIITVFNPKD